MIVDGKKIAEKIYSKIRNEVELLSHTPRLAIITCAPTFETQKYLDLKKKKATEVGIATGIIHLPEESTTEDFQKIIAHTVSESDGIIVQLPLPQGIDIRVVLNTVPPSHDVDALNQESTHVLPPVVGAIEEILGTYEVSSFNKHVTILGSGRLVGVPASQWFESHGSYVSIVTKETEDISFYTKNADIIVCGTGVPGLLLPSMIKDGVMILDAGTSEERGLLKGDADPACAEKASLFTPVPGGIGPVTVAVLLRNLIVLMKKE